VVDSLLAQFLAVPGNVLKKVTLSATHPVIFSVCHKLLLQHPEKRWLLGFVL